MIKCSLRPGIYSLNQWLSYPPVWGICRYKEQGEMVRLVQVREEDSLISLLQGGINMITSGWAIYVLH